MQVALVGNGPKLLEKEYGRQIDHYDIVVRFNKFQIEGYEKHTGVKTDYWVLNIAADTYDFVFNYGKDIDAEILVVEDHRFETYPKLVGQFERLLYLLKTYNKDFSLIPSHDVEYVSTSIGYPRYKVATTGTLAAHNFNCRYGAVDLFGFNMLDPKVNPQHYFERGKCNLTAAHNPMLEAKWIKQQDNIKEVV